MSDRGPFIKVPLDLRAEPWYHNDRALARYLRAMADERDSRPWRTRLPDAAWLPILAAFGYACAYCGTAGVPMEQEHRMPHSQGGPTDANNIVPACKPCNRRKGTQHPDLWPIRAGMA